jgi:hypothetical protein
MATSELACTYAALILHDDGLEITADNITTILKAANVTVEAYWPSLFAKLFAKKNMDDLITNVGAGACWRRRLLFRVLPLVDCSHVPSAGRTVHQIMY